MRIDGICALLATASTYLVYLDISKEERGLTQGRVSIQSLTSVESNHAHWPLES